MISLSSTASESFMEGNANSFEIHRMLITTNRYSLARELSRKPGLRRRQK